MKTSSKQMQAVVVKEPGGAEQLTLGTVLMPEPANDELLVRVKATALNRADTLQRKGLYPPPKGASPILGLEMAGVIEHVGANCSGWHVGDRVFSLLPGGGYAQYVTLPHKMALPVPENLSFEQAAGIAEVFLTAYQALFWIARIQAGETVLIHAGASGVGTAAIQLVNVAGATALTTVGTPQKCAFCQQLGASAALNYKEEPFTQKILKLTEKRGVNILLDFVGASFWEQNLSVLAIDGRIVLIALLGGCTLEHVDLRPFLAKRIQLTGTTLRTRSQEYKARLTQEFAGFALPRFADGRLKPVIDRVFSWQDASEAHRYMEANQNMGKIILHIE